MKATLRWRHPSEHQEFTEGEELLFAIRRPDGSWFVDSGVVAFVGGEVVLRSEADWVYPWTSVDRWVPMGEVVAGLGDCQLANDAER